MDVSGELLLLAVGVTIVLGLPALIVAHRTGRNVAFNRLITAFGIIMAICLIAAWIAILNG